MSDLKERFQSLDRVPAPDLWRDISRREPADLALGPDWRKVGVAALALFVAAAGIGFAAWAFLGGRDSRRTVNPAPVVRKANGKIAFVGGEGKPFSLLGPGGQPRIYLMNPDGSGISQIRGRGKGPAWSPDGTRLAYLIGGEFGGYELHVLDVANRHDSLLLTARQYLEGPMWSPDGTMIAVALGGSNTDYDLYVLNADGSDIHPITSMAGSEFAPDWSPDGTRVVFAGSESRDSGLTNLFVVGSDGQGLRRLTETLHFQSSPRWSPDGRRIAFVDGQGQDHPAAVKVMKSDGTGERSLFTCTNCLMDVAWSPDGSKLLFSRMQRLAWHLWVIDADGTHLGQVDTGSLQACCASWQPVAISAPPVSPTPIPSGTLPPTPQASILGDIAYQTGSGREARIWVMHPDGSGAHLVGPGSDPAWAPDGSRIAFRTNFVKRRVDIAVMNSDGSGKRTLVADVSTVGFLGFGGAPAWSPDGSTIVFAREEGLFLVALSSGQPRFLADSPDCVEYDPAWSPDGSQIVFGVGCTEPTSDAQAGLAIVNADGTGWHRIIGPGGLAQFPPANPTWSPDGRYIAFDTEGEAGGTIYIANADGSNVFAFAPGTAPSWSPDGSRIAFADGHIYVIGVDGTGRKRLTSTVAGEGYPAWEPTVGSP